MLFYEKDLIKIILDLHVCECENGTAPIVNFKRLTQATVIFY